MFNNIKLFELVKSKKLVDNDFISDINKLIENKKNFNLEEILLKKKIIGLEKIAELRSEVYNIPYANLVDIEIPKKFLNLIGKDLSKNYSAICFDSEGAEMRVALVSPDLKAMEAINFLANQQGRVVKYYVMSKISFNAAFKQYKEMEEEVSSAIEKKIKEDKEDLFQIKNEEDDNILDLEDANSAPVAKIVSIIIKNAIDSRSSDIHIEPFEDESRVRYRVDGILKNALVLPRNIHSAVVARIKVMAKMKMDETRIPQDGRIVLVFDGREIDFRISTLPIGADKEKVVLRILDTAKGVLTLDQLGFNKHVLEIFKRSIKKTNGIILSTGPTGSGKTTTLYSIINILNKEGVNISTLEDPVEYQMKGVNQSQIRPKIGYSFATGLRSLVRQDPDIIMVGEIRDEETAELSVHAGLTGHLVLSTLHTNDALGAILRLIDMKVEPVLLASILRIVIAQRLVRLLCPYCKKESNSEYVLEFIEKAKKELEGLSEKSILGEVSSLNGDFENLNKLKIYEAIGCNRCQNLGYSDRLAISEGIEVDENLKNIIVNDMSNLNIESIKNSQDFISMRQDGFLKVLNGLTTIEEVLRVIES